MERVKIVKVGDGEDIHTIKVGDTVDAKFNRGEKFYKATVVAVNKNHTYDLEYYDGATEQGVEKKLLHKILPEGYVEPEAGGSSSEEEEEEEEAKEEKGGEDAPPPPLQITEGGEEGKEGEVPPPAIMEGETQKLETPDLETLQITDGKEGEVVGEGASEGAIVPAGEVPEGAIVPAEEQPPKKKKKKKKYKKVTIRFVHDLHEEETTTEHLQPTAWLGTLPSEAAKAHGHEEAAKFLLEMEDQARKAARKKFRAVQALTVGMFAGRDKKKYEGMV